MIAIGFGFLMKILGFAAYWSVVMYLTTKIYPKATQPSSVHYAILTLLAVAGIYVANKFESLVLHFTGLDKNKGA